jgi:signal transduction histidine kinase
MRSFWAKIVGHAPGFSLEARIFNAICLTSAVQLFLTMFFNVLLGIPQLVVLMGAVFVTAVLCYYFSRFKMMLNGSIIAYMIVLNVLMVVNFKYNSGINGPSLLIFIFSYFLIVSIVPKKQYWFWATLNLVIVATLLFVEYKYPGTIINTYSDNKSRFADIGYTYVFVAFFIFMIATHIRASYHTERELVEQKANELEEANDTKNKLFSILAHDLRSPLASIQNYLEILMEFKLDEEERIAISRDLLNSTQNTQQMLSNLLSWSKSQMEGVNVKMVNVNLKEALQSTFHIHQTIAAEKGIQLTDQVPGSIFITADVDMLQLVIRNLVNNAIKFTGPGGHILVSAVVIGNECRISVKDNGKGIPSKQQADIFSLKANSTVGTKNEKGVGLGLVLCKEFTELQNGRITFESQPGTGTTFYVSLRLGEGANNLNTSGTETLVTKS